MNELKTKIIETLIVQAEQLGDIKNDTIERIKTIDNMLEEEKSNLEDYKVREESLREEILIEAKDIHIIDNEHVEESDDLDSLIQQIQKKLSDKKINEEHEDQNNKIDLPQETFPNIINLEDHKNKVDVLSINIDQINWQFTIRSANCLKNSDLKTIKDIMNMGINGLLTVPNFGRRSLREIESFLFKEYGLIIPEGTNSKEIYPTDVIDLGIKTVVNNVLKDLSPWEEAILKYRNGLFDKRFDKKQDAWVEFDASEYGLPIGTRWNYQTCYYAQNIDIKEIFQLDIPIWSYSTTIKYIRKAQRKLKHPTRARKLRPFIIYAEELANKMGKTLDRHSDKYDPPFNYTNIPECNNFYYAFVCQIFGERFKR